MSEHIAATPTYADRLSPFAPEMAELLRVIWEDYLDSGGGVLMRPDRMAQVRDLIQRLP